jgi:S13-like protein
MSLPTITAEQRRAGLAKAAEVRQARAAAKDGIREGTVSPVAVLSDQDSPLWAAPVKSLLLAVPGIGTARAAELMARVGIDPRRRVRGLGPVQRRQLAEILAA